MSNDVESRLARVEGRFLQGEGVRRQLYDDYLALSVALNETSKELARWRRSESAAVLALKNANRQYGDRESYLLASDERAGGKNDTERKRNADALIVEEKKQGGMLYGSWQAVLQAEADLQASTVEKEIQIDEFSAERYLLRAIAGLASSLG